MEIDLTKISKELLIKLWEDANKVEKGNYIDWLSEHNFGSELANDMAMEIRSDILYYICVGGDGIERGCQDYAKIFDVVIENIKNDPDLLREYGIAKKKITKKCPYLLSEIDWNMYKNF